MKRTILYTVVLLLPALMALPVVQVSSAAGAKIQVRHVGPAKAVVFSRILGENHALGEENDVDVPLQVKNFTRKLPEVYDLPRPSALTSHPGEAMTPGWQDSSSGLICEQPGNSLAREDG